MERIIEALSMALQYMGVTDDYEEVEINGEMMSRLDAIQNIETALSLCESIIKNDKNFKE